ncbi:2-oxoglutarate dehydrogenase, E2 component, dihydrolipoamide succinyltransferase [Kribbella qitaiheensis]|uniref:2-oxoglutarate dehydrogenase, E2 component, dihydrolipoamide succinyltransferase n=1 Tax=Kribbella qitaiheensis TaxID=1544730 RepID=UPI0036119645
MPTSVSLPALGESVTEGTVTRWLKQVGDTVAVDEPLLEVSTDKVDTEIPSPVAGTLLEIKAAEDETVEVGAELAVIGDAGESSGTPDAAPAQEAPAAEAQAAPAQEAPAAQAPAEQAPAAQAPAEQAPAKEVPAAEAPAPQAPAGDASPATAPAEAASPAAGQASSGTSVTLPALGESVTEGTVTRWLKQVGDDVAVDEPLLEVSTDKVDTEIPSPVAGKLLEIKVAEDETVEVGAELAVVGTGDAAPAASAPAPAAPAESAPAASAPAAAAPAAAAPAPAPAAQAPAAAPAPQAAPAQAPAAQPAAQAPAPQSAQPAAQAPAPQSAPAQAPSAPAPSAPAPAASSNGSSSDGPNYVTPLVRKLAAEHQVDLGAVQGTGVGGRIRKQDVIAAAEAKKAAAAAAPAASAPAASSAPAKAAPAISPLRGTTEKMSRIRKAIANHMVNSLHVSAQLTTVVEVDVTEIAKLRNAKKAEFQAREGVKLSFLPFFALAAIDALKQYPKLNASINDEAGEVTYHAAEHLGIAVDAEKGLMVPVVHNAGDLNIAGLAKKIADLADRTRNNKVLPDEMAGGTFTITNTGSRGALFDTPILNQPQVGMLGTGAVVKRPVVITHPELGETIAIRHMVYLALTYDHRLVDGADAARYLTAVKQRLEEAQFDV